MFDHERACYFATSGKTYEDIYWIDFTVKMADCQKIIIFWDQGQIEMAKLEQDKSLVLYCNTTCIVFPSGGNVVHTYFYDPKNGLYS